MRMTSGECSDWGMMDTVFLTMAAWRGRFHPRLPRGFMSGAEKNYSALTPVKRTPCKVAAQRATVRDKGLVTYDRLMPCPTFSLPSRVEHLLIERNGNVVDVICEELSLPHLYVVDLIKFGAVFYYALEHPTPPPCASSEQLDAYHRVLKLRASRIEERLSLKRKELQEAQKTYRIGSSSQLFEAGTYLRDAGCMVLTGYEE